MENDYQKSNSFTKPFKSFTHSRRENSSSSTKLVTETGGIASIRGGSRAAATSRMERFVIIVNGFLPLTIITKCSILDVAAALDPLLSIKQSLSSKGITERAIDLNLNARRTVSQTKYESAGRE